MSASNMNWIVLTIHQGKFTKLTVAVLKEFCQNKGITPVGRKDDIIKQIQQHCQI
jgi:hypothetical protein